MSPKERTVVRAVIKALRFDNADDLRAYATSYGLRPKLDTQAGRAMASADLLEALIEAKE